MRGSFGKAERIRSEQEPLINRVAVRDNYNCQICGSLVLPKGRVGYALHPLESGQTENKLENNFTVCWDCITTEDHQQIELRIKQIGEIKNAESGLSTLYAKAVARTLVERVRLFSYAGRALFVRRLGVVFAVGLLLLVVMTLLATLVGTLFVSVETGLRWLTTTLTLLEVVAKLVLANSWLAVAGVTTGYLVHVAERERDYLRGVQRERRRGGGRDLPSYDGTQRPCWHLLAGFTAFGLLGCLDWLLLVLNLRDGSPVGAALLWLIGAVGVAYTLRAALYEDRDASGFQVRPTPWVFASRTALALGGLEVVRMLAGRPDLLALPRLLTQGGFALAPVVGGLYVLRRTIERRWGWRLRLPTSLLQRGGIREREPHQRPNSDESTFEQQTDDDLER